MMIMQLMTALELLAERLLSVRFISLCVDMAQVGNEGLGLFTSGVLFAHTAEMAQNTIYPYWALLRLAGVLLNSVDPTPGATDFAKIAWVEIPKLIEWLF